MDVEIFNKILKVVEDSIKASLDLYGKLNETRMELQNEIKDINAKIGWLADEVKESNNLMRVRPCFKDSQDGMKFKHDAVGNIDDIKNMLTAQSKENRYLKFAIGIMTLVVIVLKVI